MTDKSFFTIIPYKNKLLKFQKPSQAIAYYKNFQLNLLTGEKSQKKIESWVQTLHFELYNHCEKNRFIHLFYECGYLFEQHSDFINEEDLLAIDITYSHVADFELGPLSKVIKLNLKEGPNFKNYEKKFNQGYRELLEGNCYQFNLTENFCYQFKDNYSPMDFLSKLWQDPSKRGAYASATFIGSMNKLYLSNSPECLFQFEKGELITRPIKGTFKRQTHTINETKSLWKKLIKDKKSQAELYMITDLLRNDLARIDLPKATVTKMKAPLIVPGLIHQYSEIKINLRRHVSLKDIVIKMFPGGSITGAPKKRVMGILHSLENRTRGFYCGSTIVLAPKIAMASINIRSSVIDFKARELSYQAGGGITLLSTAKSEFEELNLKHDSYLTLLTL